MVTNKFLADASSHTASGDYNFGVARMWIPEDNPVISTVAIGTGEARYLPASGVIVIWDGSVWKNFTLKTGGMSPDDPSVSGVIVSWLGTTEGNKVTPVSQRVDTWTDEWTLGNHASQGTENLRPIVLSGVKNGYDIVQFGGTQYMDGTYHGFFSGADKAASVIAVVRCDIQNAGFQEFWSVGNSTTDTPFFAFGAGQASIRDFRTGRRDDVAGTIGVPRGDNIKVRDWQVVGFNFTGPEIEMFVDGETIFVTASGASLGPMTVDRLGIGALLRIGVADQFFGHMGEMIVYSSGIPGSAMSGISEYLMDKWGI